MQDYANDFVQTSGIIEPGASKEFPFESPTPGDISVLLKAQEALYPESNSNPDNTNLNENGSVTFSRPSVDLATMGGSDFFRASSTGFNTNRNRSQTQNIALRIAADNRSRFFGDQFDREGDLFL